MAKREPCRWAGVCFLMVQHAAGNLADGDMSCLLMHSLVQASGGARQAWGSWGESWRTWWSESEPGVQPSKQENETSLSQPCPTSYSGCFKVEGCVYVPRGEAAKLDEFPELEGRAGRCLKRVDLLSTVPPGVELHQFEPQGEALRVKTATSKAADHWIPLGSLCGEGQAWTASSCQQLCPSQLSWQACIAQAGCVYVYASNKASNLPRAHRAALEPAFGNCAAANGLIGSSPVGSKWHIGAALLSSKKGLEAKALDPNSKEAIKVQLSFPDEPDLPVEEPCKEGDEAAAHAPTSPWPATAPRKESALAACDCSYWRHAAAAGKISDVRTDYDFARQPAQEFLLIDYGCWRNVLSKKLRMPVQFEYVATPDTGNHDRLDKFMLDETPGLLDWQPPRWSRSDKYGVPYDVGHLVMANHFDSYRELIHATNMMTNVVPQLSDMNRFAWLAVEYLTECAREGAGKENVFVMGGCVWPEKPDHIDGFEKMEKLGYQILIPDNCWKIISTQSRGHVAFYMPNSAEARISKSSALGKDGIEKGLTELSQFVVSLAELEGKLAKRQTPQSFKLAPGARYDKDHKPSAQQMAEAGWSLKCDKK